jgi:tetratricopeptide (TPR) repeat protein
MYAKRSSRVALIVSLAASLINGTVWAQAAISPCGPLETHYGPFDYRNQKNYLGVVEQHHFSPQVEALIGGDTSVHIGGDLDYTLKAFPNHHRALLSLMRLGEKMHSPQPMGMTYSVECYFERALRFRPNDTTVRMIYASYLNKNRRGAEATQQLKQASDAAGDNPFTHYNLGLLYLEQENYPLALAHAHTAYALGFTRPELREQLQLRGKWKEPMNQVAK